MIEIWSKMYIGLHVKYRLFLLDFNETRIFIDSLSKTTPISNFMKIHPVGAELFYADGRTDWWTDPTKLTLAFRNFVGPPKTYIVTKIAVFLCQALHINFYVRPFTSISMSGPSHQFLCLALHINFPSEATHRSTPAFHPSRHPPDVTLWRCSNSDVICFRLS